MSNENYAILRKSIYGKINEMSKLISDLEDRVEKIESGNKHYFYAMWENNTAITNTTTLNEYTRISYPNTPWIVFHTSGSFELINDNGLIKLKYLGTEVKRFSLTIDFNGYKTQGNAGQYQFEMRINGYKAGPSPANRFDAINKWQMISITGMPKLSPGYFMTFHVKNIKDTDPMIVSRLSFTIYEI